MGLLDASTDITSGMALLAALLNRANMGLRPRPSLYEGWQDEAGIDPALWGTAVTGGGVVARDTLEPPYLKVIVSGNGPLDTATLFGLQRWYCAPDPADANYLDEFIIRRTHFEFVARFTIAAQIDNTAFFMGFGFAQNVTEIAPNTIGFVMDGTDNVLAQCSDLVGTTTAAFLAAAAAVNWHKYGIEVRRSEIHFSLDDALITSIAANLPNYSMYPVFHVVQENNPGMAMLEVAALRIWVEDALL